MQLVLVVTVYIHPSPFGTDAAPLFHGKSAATFAPRTETRWEPVRWSGTKDRRREIVLDPEDRSS